MRAVGYFCRRMFVPIFVLFVIIYQLVLTDRKNVDDLNENLQNISKIKTNNEEVSDSIKNQEVKKESIKKELRGGNNDDPKNILDKNTNERKKKRPKGEEKELSKTDDPMIEGGEDSNQENRERRDFIKSMMKHAWSNYVKYSWGENELKPISKSAHRASVFGSSAMGATIVDAMDTLYIMGFHEEFQKGREWIENHLNPSNMNGYVSVFETNIRYVGGLLTLYSFTGDSLFKDKAVSIVDRLLPAFNTPTGVPLAQVNLRGGHGQNFGWASGGSSILSEFGTLHMEFSYLSDITGNPVYKEKVEKLRTFVKQKFSERTDNLYPNYLNPRTGNWGDQHTSLGAMGDSFYEYLIKEWLRSGRRDSQAKDMFDEAARGIVEKLVQVSPGGLTYLADSRNGRLEHKMGELACFSGGMFALAAATENNIHSSRWMQIGKGITNTCHEAWDRAETKIAPEAFHFQGGKEAIALNYNERYYILRPETVESYFYLWRLTKDPKYREWGWEAAQAIEKICRTPGGYSGIRNVYEINSEMDDVQQSFFLAETLKYLYLLFSDDELINLDQWVFNTEAHPLPIKGYNTMYRPHFYP